jgi:polysaccharide chain length determinant protein (PEP-CTERM system associated)
MQDNLDKLMTHVHGIWRYRWYILLAAWLVALTGWGVVALLPDRYESSAHVYVDSESILKPVLRGIALDSIGLEERLGLMSKELLSRPVLEKVFRSVDLDLKARNNLEREELLVELQKSIVISATRTHRSNRAEPPNLYIITAREESPDLAYRIVQALLTIFVEDTLGGSRQDKGVAQRFIEQQIAEYEARLVAAENRLREFKRQNVGLLPEQGTTYYQRLQAARTSLDEIELQLREQQYRRDEMARQMEGVNPEQRATTPTGAPIRSPLEERITEMERRQDDLRLKYTDSHPEVVAARDMLDTLRRQLDESRSQPSGTDAALSTQSPMYQQLRLSLGEAEANIAAIRVRREEYGRRVNELQQQIETLPKVEAELVALNRDYDINKQNYDALIARREAASMSDQAEQTGEQAKFRVIDPPRVPLAPSAPNRPLFSSAVLLAALGAGIGLAFFLAQIRPAFYSGRALSQAMELPVFGSISMLSLAGTMRLRYTAYVMWLCGMGILLLAYGAVLYLNIKGIHLADMANNLRGDV